MTLALLQDVPLRRLNTLGVSATAATVVPVRQITELHELPGCLSRLRDAGAPGPAIVLGGGSNWLPIGHLAQPIVLMQLTGQRVLSQPTQADDSVLIEAAAGASWDGLVQWSLQQDLAGLENLSLIPGTVGGAPIQNIGAYGVELSECFDSLEALHLETGAMRCFDRAECAFGYRDSVFKHAAGQPWMITSVRLRLRPGARSRLNLDYGDLGAWLREAGITHPKAQDVARAVCAIRRSKLPDPAVLGNAGSFFKNPIVSADQARHLRASHPALPIWPLAHRSQATDSASMASSPGASPAESFKLPAAWLIEQCGWKGVRDGDAGVHAAHALVLVNHGAATGEQMLALAHRIMTSVKERFDVQLEPEPRIVQGTPTG